MFTLSEVSVGIMARSAVDAISELCSSFLKGGEPALIASIASGLCIHALLSISRITTAQMAQIEIKMGSTY